MTSTSPSLAPTVLPVRALVWVFHLLLPLLGLWLLLGDPATDLEWHDPVSHFWLVVAVALVNVALGGWMSVAARRRGDARLFLVALAFLASAAFLLLHGLATPGVVLSHANLGFDLAQPAGLAVAAVCAVASSLRLPGNRLRGGWQVGLLAGLAALVAAWATVSLVDIAPLNRPVQPRDVEGWLAIPAVVVVGLYLLAAGRYFALHRRRPAAMLVSLITAFVLLAEAMVAVTLAVKWHLSWWEWHLLLTAGFAFVAYSAYVQYAREGGSAGVFDTITLSATARRIREEYATALEELVAALEEGERTGTGSGVVVAQVGERFGLSELQRAVLDRAGTALAAERQLSRRLAALVAVGEQTRVGAAEPELIENVRALVTPAFGEVELGLVSDGSIRMDGDEYDPAQLVDDDALLLPLTVKGRVAGALRAPKAAAAHQAGPDRDLLATLANQLSIALENARLYGELETLFRQYLSPDVAAALLADPDQAALGGSVVEVTALFADLRGFTTFSESVPPPEIVRMLNRYHGAAVPCVLDGGGTIVQFVGDALLALFNAPARQPDHAVRAVRAGLAMQEAVEAIAHGEPGWPRFRVGINTGPALVGNIGSETLRGFNAMGDAVNVASRLQGIAEPGQVVVGEATLRQLGPELALLGPGVVARSLGELPVKGRRAPVHPYVVGSAAPAQRSPTP